MTLWFGMVRLIALRYVARFGQGFSRIVEIESSPFKYNFIRRQVYGEILFKKRDIYETGKHI
jgi:hypothetical protein